MPWIHHCTCQSHSEPSCLPQDQCSCRPPPLSEQACTLWPSTEVWSCSACSSFTIHRRSSRGPRHIHSTVYRNMTPLMRKLPQEIFSYTLKVTTDCYVMYFIKVSISYSFFNLPGAWGFTWTHWTSSWDWWWFCLTAAVAGGSKQQHFDFSFNVTFHRAEQNHVLLLAAHARC